jgi:DNA-directed RNA polymerase specialized sigma24 family protein
MVAMIAGLHSPRRKPQVNAMDQVSGHVQVGRQVLDQVLAALPEGQRRVLILRFGLDSGTPRTLEEVGAVMGFSRGGPALRARRPHGPAPRQDPRPPGDDPPA